MLIKYEYTVSIGLLRSGFEGISAAAPVEQLHAFFFIKNHDSFKKIDALFVMKDCF